MKAANRESPLRKAADSLGGTTVGRWLVSRAVCFAAPYFGSIAPTFTKLGPGLVEAKVKNRRGVHNHLGSVHAIAMCNAAELVAGTCTDLSVPPGLRWIPVGMTVEYKRIARTDLRALCDAREIDFSAPGDVVVPVRIFDTKGEEVFAARVTMRVSEKKSRTNAA